MSDAWYYADGGQPKGPVTLQALKAQLHRLPNWKEILVRSEGYDGWKKAGIVTELESVLPPLPNTSAIEKSSESRKAPLWSNVKGSEEKKRWRVGKVVAGILAAMALITAVAFGKVIGKGSYDFLSQSSQVTLAWLVEKFMHGVATQLRKELPKKIDDLTTMVSADSEGTNIIIRLETQNDWTAANSSNLRQQIVKNVCANWVTSKVVNYGGRFRYVFHGSGGSVVADISVAQADCPS